jgi:hypothetical protein
MPFFARTGRFEATPKELAKTRSMRREREKDFIVGSPLEVLLKNKRPAGFNTPVAFRFFRFP